MPTQPQQIQASPMTRKTRVLRVAWLFLAAQSVQAQTLSVLHNFSGTHGDGAFPNASLVQDAAGNLYVTTENGGASNFGTVFKLDATGKETVLHSFDGGADGANSRSAVPNGNPDGPMPGVISSFAYMQGMVAGMGYA